jgi:hypothetical protein
MNQDLPAIQSSIQEQLNNLGKPMPMEIPMSKWDASFPSPFDTGRRPIDRKRLQASLKPLNLLSNQPNSSQLLSPWSPPQTASSQNSLEDLKSGRRKSGGLFRCACGANFEKKDDFYDHYAHKCLSIQNVCNICKRRFFRKQDLKHHMMCHVVATVVCDGCGFKFSRQQALTRHRRHCKGH